MSVKELEERVDKLSADIVQQKKVLKEREKSKSAVQRRINAIRDPLSRMPLEISSEIFIQCLLSHPAPGAHVAPMLLLRICNAWTDIVLATPPLWAAIHVDEPRVNLTRLLDKWFKRAGSRVLSISLPWELTKKIAVIIGRHAHQLQELRMYHEDADINLITTVGPFPVLRTLTIVGLILEEDEMSLSKEVTNSTMEILRACPNLVEFTSRGVCYGSDTYGDDPAEVLNFPHMQHLRFESSNYIGNDEILQYFSAPCLQTLCLPSYSGLRAEDVLSFLRRCLPPLRELTMGDHFPTIAGNWTFNKMRECLSLLPKLEQIQLLRPTAPYLNHVVDILTELGPKSFEYRLLFVAHAAPR